MAALVLDDAREYIFPIFLVESAKNDVYLEKREFLGTAFFVSKQGDAITANHVIPKPDEIPIGKKVIAIVQVGTEQKICLLTHSATCEAFDLALIHINLQNTKYLTITSEEVPAGADIQLVGIPSHEVWVSGKEMRILKGHVTLAAKQLELNIAVPLGMSGSPVFIGTKVAAFATMSVKSEEVEEYKEDLVTVSNNKEKIIITKATRVTHYGMAFPFYKLRNIESPVFNNKTLMQLIEERNNEP